MTIPYTCTSCGHPMSIPDHHAGRELYCTSCKGAFVAPGLPAPPPPPPSSEPGGEAAGWTPCPACGGWSAPDVAFCGSCGSPLAAAPPVGGLMKRPGVVTLLAVLHFIGAAFMLLLAVVMVAIMADEPVVGAVFLGFYLVFGGLSLATGLGLWKMRPWGRTLQIALSCVGLVGFPVGTAVSALILYYMFQPAAKLLFSGKTEDELDAADRVVLAQKAGVSAVAVAAAVLAMAVISVFVAGVIAAIAIPNFINAVERGRQKRSMADMRSIATAIECYAVDNDEYPSAVTSMDELEPLVVPVYLRTLPRVDGWENPFQLWTAEDGMAYQIVSLGKDGVVGKQNGGPTRSFDDDIVYRNGAFRQWPEGIDPN